MLTPRAASDGIDGWDTDDKGRPVLKVRVRARPIDGKANAALIALMAKALDVPRSRIMLTGSETARLKTLEISGLERSPDEVLAFFGETARPR
jgi:uncharacterized protein YggU (UPF0235/DUF167 family)